MKPASAAIAISIFVSGLAATVPAGATMARPWLCRIKPVFSSDHPMRFEAVKQSGRTWRLMLMTFDPMGGHDGYTIVESRDLRSADTSGAGELNAGRYFAVAQYLEGGEWICPAYAQRSDNYNPSEIASICYGAESENCAVKLIVKPAMPQSAPSSGH